MKKLFISQPMKGKTDEEILEERRKAVDTARKQLGEDVEIIDSFFQDAPHDANPLWFLARSLELLSTADIAYFAKGWEKARGCKIENECAIAYGIDVIEDYSDVEETGLSFGVALELLKKGCKVAREGWNGKGMFLYHVPAASYAPCTSIGEECATDDGKVPYGAYIAMKTVQGNVVPWLASQTDMLAEDWIIVE